MNYTKYTETKSPVPDTLFKHVLLYSFWKLIDKKEVRVFSKCKINQSYV